MKKKNINDLRIVDREALPGQPVTTFLKKREEMDKYLESKRSNSVNRLYQENKKGNDFYENRNLGKFQLIRGGKEEKVGLFNFFANEQCLYYTGGEEDYRNILWSVQVTQLIDPNQFDWQKYEKYNEEKDEGHLEGEMLEWEKKRVRDVSQVHCCSRIGGMK